MDGSRRGGGGGGGKKGSAPAPAWKKAAGASLSTKAKKEYLKWKREQKRGQADDASDSDWGLEEAPAGGEAAAAGAAAAAAAAAAEGSGGEGGSRTGGLAQRVGKPRQRQQRPPPPASVDSRAASDADTKPPPPQRRQRQEAARAAPDDSPLRYVPAVELPPGDVPESIRAVCGRLAAMRLPRVREDEVGFTAEGRSLGMPKRPAWRGVVRNAAQLHALEESSFQAWVDRLYAGVDDPSRVSFFEPKLDFWRQLWRVLERSDVAVMIVDARNPLLHFSEALARHVLDEHGMAALLVLNKCDLVPAAAVEAWRGFFEGRYPGLRVVASSAAPGAAGGAAEAIMDAVLDCCVAREGRRVKVAEVVGMSRDEVLAHSKARNTHSKRDRPQLAAAAAAAAAPPPEPVQATAARPAAAAAAAAGRSVAPEADDTSGDGDGEEEWALRGTKAKKKLAVRKKRTQRMQGAAAAAAAGGGAGGGAGSEPAGGTEGGGRRGAGKLAPSESGAAAGKSGAKQRAARGRRPPRGDAASTGASTGAEQAGGSEEDGDGDDGDVGGATTGTEADDGDNDNAAFERLADDEDAGDFLSDDGEGDGDGEHADADAAAEPAPASPAAAWGGHGARGGRDARGRGRPVVVCVVGEPNVGKSSTMNALLGAKRVAVSSHPGRTKHYQTHVMCPSLMLCDCPGLVFPRLDVSLHMQVLFGSYPIARCRDPYSVVRYLAERIWPRLHVTLGLRPVAEDEEDDEGGGRARDPGAWRDEDWTPLALCEALAARHNWRSRRGGRLDVYRAANWILRSALAGRGGVNVAFLPPAASPEAPLAS